MVPLTKGRGRRFARPIPLPAAGIFLGVVIFTIQSVWAFRAMDWSQTESIYELIYRVLLAVIALELIRTLMTHDLQSVLELLAFVVARKTLKPDLSVYDIFLSVVAFAILLVCRRYLFLPAPAPTEPPPAPKESPAAT